MNEQGNVYSLGKQAGSNYQPEPEWDAPDECEVVHPNQPCPESYDEPVVVKLAECAQDSVVVDEDGVWYNASEESARALMTRLHDQLGPLSPLGGGDVQFVDRIRGRLVDIIATIDMGPGAVPARPRVREQVVALLDDFDAWYQPPAVTQPVPECHHEPVTGMGHPAYSTRPMPHSLALYAPTKIVEIQKMLTKLYGGATVNMGLGYYTDEDGVVVRESVAVITVYSEHEINPNGFIHMLHEAGEEAVLYVLDGEVLMSRKAGA